MKIRFEQNVYGRGFVSRVVFGMGAGYIGGRTLFLGCNSGSKQWREDHRGGQRHFMAGCKYPWEHIQIGSLEFGLTQNANAVPHAKSY